MLIIGSVGSEEEAIEIRFIAKVVVVANRFKNL